LPSEPGAKKLVTGGNVEVKMREKRKLKPRGKGGWKN